MTNGKVTQHANSVFEQPWWLDIVAPGKWEEISIQKDGRMEARWPIVYNGDKALMPRETQNIGIWFRDEPNESISSRLSREKSDIGQLLEKADKKFWDCRISTDNSYVLPFIWAGFHVAPMFTYVLDNLSDTEKVRQGYSKTVKKNLKRASKIVEIVEDPDTSVLLDCMRATYRAQNRKMPISESLIESIVEESLRYNSGKMIGAVDTSGAYHACSFFVYDQNRCYYLLSGSVPELRTSGAQTLILDNAITFASSRSKIFDFEGSMVEGIEKFFRQFGGRPSEYYRISRLSVADVLKESVKPKVKRILGYK